MPGVIGEYGASVDESMPGSPAKSMPPFWVTTKPRSDAGAAELAPPPTTATVLMAPVATSTRESAPLGTLVKTSVPSAHQTGPSGNGTCATTISAVGTA